MSPTRAGEPRTAETAPSAAPRGGSRGLVAAARAALAAIAFLTRVPVGRLAVLEARDVARGAPLFPLVGGGVGLAAGLSADALVPALPGALAGALAVALAVVLTGAMHHDALADVCDALGGTDRERSLAIMRDHAVGAFGGLALVLVVLVDALALGGLAASGDAAVVALAAGAAGRAAMLPIARALPYARAGAGQGRVLEGLGWGGCALGALLALVLALPAGTAGLAGLGAAFVVSVVVAVYARHWLGGVTGDVLGAVAKLGESAALVVGLAVVG